MSTHATADSSITNSIYELQVDNRMGRMQLLEQG